MIAKFVDELAAHAGDTKLLGIVSSYPIQGAPSARTAAPGRDDSGQTWDARAGFRAGLAPSTRKQTFEIRFLQHAPSDYANVAE